MAYDAERARDLSEFDPEAIKVTRQGDTAHAESLTWLEREWWDATDEMLGDIVDSELAADALREPEAPLLIDSFPGSELDPILDISLEDFQDEQRSGVIGSRRAVLETPGEFARFANGRIGHETIRYPVTLGESPKLRRN